MEKKKNVIWGFVRNALKAELGKITDTTYLK